MTVYKYIGRTAEGQMKKGTVEASTKETAVKKLRNEGINPREVTESNSIFHKNIALGNGVKNQDFVIYCRQFATLIRAGISIVDATHILADQTSSKMLAKTLKQVAELINSGQSFSTAAAKAPKIFPPLFVNMVRAGEASGDLDATLERLASYYEKQYDLKKKVQSTLTYPIVLFFVTIIVVTFMLTTIVPKFAEMFADFGAELPWLTVLILKLSEGISSAWWVFLLLFLFGIFLIHQLYKRNQQVYYSLHLAFLRMPIFGPLLQKSAIARMTRTLASLFSSAVPILDALLIVEKVIGNPVIGRVVLDARASLEQGSTLSAPLAKSWVFPPLVTQMIAVGEQTGSLDYMLEKVADFYEAEVDRTVDTLKSLIEPLMIILLAGVVGIIVVSVMWPMFSLYQQF